MRRPNNVPIGCAGCGMKGARVYTQIDDRENPLDLGYGFCPKCKTIPLTKRSRTQVMRNYSYYSVIKPAKISLAREDADAIEEFLASTKRTNYDPTSEETFVECTICAEWEGHTKECVVPILQKLIAKEQKHGI